MRSVLKYILFLAGVFLFFGLIRQVAAFNISSYNTAVLFDYIFPLFVISLLLLIVDPGKIAYGVLDAVLLCLGGLYCLASAVHPVSNAIVRFQEIFPYVLLYFAVKIFASLFKNLFRLVLFYTLAVWTCSECLIGLSQIFGSNVQSHSFMLTGSFANPGPFGCFISLTMAIAAAFAIKHRDIVRCLDTSLIKTAMSVDIKRLSASNFVKWSTFRLLPFLTSIFVLTIGIIVLPASMSRSAWAGLGVSVILALCVEAKTLAWVRRHPMLSACAFTLFLTAICGIFVLKKDSAVGRLHIWNMEIRAVAGEPLTGYGPGCGMGPYGRAQAAYFMEEERPASVVKVAGCPEYAFNEYLRIGMESGIAGLILALLAAVAACRNLIRSGSVFGYGLVAFSIFSFASYPLAVPQLSLICVILLALSSTTKFGSVKCSSGTSLITCFLSAIPPLCVFIASFFVKGVYTVRSEAFDEWRSVRQFSSLGVYDEGAERLGGIYREMSWNYRYLYDYGFALHKCGRYGESNAVLSEGAEISSDPMFHNIMGKNYVQMGDYEAAEAEYATAHYMVPCRIYPMSLLMDLYREQGRSEEVRKLGREILAMPVNPKNENMRELRNRVKQDMNDYEEEIY